MRRQRIIRKKGTLPENRFKLLEEIGFLWDPVEHEWQENYKLLKQYIVENGDALVPLRHSGLGQWVANQRKARVKDRLTDERIQSLDEIGFVWNPRNLKRNNEL